MAQRYDMGPSRSQGLVDVLDRILDKGLVIAGDIRVQLADVELLTIQVRLLVCSVDKAQEIGMDWWRTDPRLSTSATPGGSLADVRRTLEGIDRRLEALEGSIESSTASSKKSSSSSKKSSSRTSTKKE